MLFRSDRKSTRLNSSHTLISYAVFCLKKKRRKFNRSALRTFTHVRPKPSNRALRPPGPGILRRPICPCPFRRVILSFFFFLRIRRPPRPTLFPYPPLFRSMYGDHRDLPSFPTRRSSDLGGRRT